MTSKRKRKGFSGVLFGVGAVFFALSALWKNESRFDFYKAASGTQVVKSISNVPEGRLISHTGLMDRDLTIKGSYVEDFSGYMLVRRTAEIYAWSEDRDDDSTSWNLEWMSGVESNSRNHGVVQELSSDRLYASVYEVGELTIKPDKMEFVDAVKKISPNSLKLIDDRLVVKGGYFNLHKNQPSNLGDERIRYDGIPVPEIATYFGKFENGKGVADTTHQRTGWVNKLIQDTGILHHLVAGDRQTALASMKEYLSALKWLVRGVGTAVVVIGFSIVFSSVFGFLFHIPVIGRIAETSSILLACVIGLPLALLAICAGYVFSHPLVLVTILCFVTLAVYWLRRRGKKSQQVIRNQLNEKFGHEVEPFEIKELEFMELAKMASADGTDSKNELSFLYDWGKKYSWDASRCDQLIAKAKNDLGIKRDFSTEEHLLNLIQLALSDGTLSRYEIKTIRKAAVNYGYEEKQIEDLMSRVRGMAVQSA